jgi:hypothetical protein
MPQKGYYQALRRFQGFRISVKPAQSLQLLTEHRLLRTFCCVLIQEHLGQLLVPTSIMQMLARSFLTAQAQPFMLPGK